MFSAAAMPDGKHFVLGLGGPYQGLRLYHVDGTLVHNFKGHADWVRAVAPDLMASLLAALELADLHRRADELPCGTNYSHACFGTIGPEAAKVAHHERSKLMMRVYALEHDEAYVAAKFAVAHAPARIR